jgi:hypothetical protein
MQTANIAIASVLVLSTAACTQIPAQNDGTQDVAVTDGTDPTTGDDDDDNTVRDPSGGSNSQSKYGWQQPIDESGIKGYTLEQIVTTKDAVVRADNTACVTCHSWASYQTRSSFCDHVASFLSMPSATGAPSDPPNAKPATLKKILKSWKAAGCPN